MSINNLTTGTCRRCGTKIPIGQDRCTQCLAWILRLLAIARSPWGTVHGEASDRLESQEREIEELKAEAIVNALENAERIANMTARAEQAEARADEAEAKLLDYTTKSGWSIKDLEDLVRWRKAKETAAAIG